MTGNLTIVGTAADHKLRTRGVSGVNSDGIDDAGLYLNFDGTSDLENYLSRPVYLGGEDSSSVAVRQDMLDEAIANVTIDTSNLVDLVSKQTITGTKTFSKKVRVGECTLEFNADTEALNFIFGQQDSDEDDDSISLVDVGEEHLDTTGFIFTPVDSSGNVTSEASATAYMVGDTSGDICNGYTQPELLWTYDCPQNVNDMVSPVVLTDGSSFNTTPMVGSTTIDLSGFSSTITNATAYITFNVQRVTTDSSNVPTATDEITQKIYTLSLNESGSLSPNTSCLTVTYSNTDYTLTVSGSTMYYITDADGTYDIITDLVSIQIKNYADSIIPETLIIPTKYNNKPVIAISDYAFYGCESTKIVVPYTIEYIGKYAFTATHNLTDLTIETGRLQLQPQNQAFEAAGNSSDLTVNFADNVTTACSWIFCPRTSSMTVEDQCFVRTVNLNNVTSIGPGAFAMCFYLTNIDASKVKLIYQLGFALSQFYLKTINLKSIEGIDSAAFYGCSALSKMYINKDSSIYNTSTNQPTIPSTTTVYTNASSLPSTWDSDLFSSITVVYDTTYDSFMQEVSTESASTMSLRNTTNSNQTSLKTYSIKGFTNK